MTQQEIFQNMTKGEWIPSNETILNDKYVKVCQFFNKAEEDYDNKEANKAAITSAVNNTYGKGINPESVEKMRLYAELEEKFQNGEVFEYNGNKYKRSVNKVEAVALLNKLRTEALTASKL